MTVKIRFQFQMVIFVMISFSTPNLIHAQDTPLNKYGLLITKRDITKQDITKKTYGEKRV